MRMPEPEPEPEPMALEDEDVLELTEVVDEPEEYEPEPRRFEMPEEGLVSKATAAASTAAFAAMHKVRERKGGMVYLGDGAITLEEIVKELLRPQLQEWLDQNLPGLVERLVREEIERLARNAK
jgi:cell pole-organizing protein PopZ